MSHARTALAVFVAALLGCGGGTGDQGGGDSERGGQDARGQTEREPAGSERRDAERGETGRVTRVIDGDTVELEGVGRVRLIGVDTTERGEECFDEATAYLKDRVGGQTVRSATNPSGRTATTALYSTSSGTTSWSTSTSRRPDGARR